MGNENELLRQGSLDQEEVAAMFEKQMMTFEQANQMIVEDLKMQLRARESAITMLEMEIAQVQKKE